MHYWHLAKVSPKDKIMMENPFVIQILTKHMEVKFKFVYYSFEYLILRITAAW